MVNRLRYKWSIDKSQVNISPLNQYYRLQYRPKLHSTSIKLSVYNGSHIPLKGFCIVRINHNHSTIPVSLLVADTNFTPTIGLNLSTQLSLTKHVMQVNSPLPNYLKEFRNCFSDIGCLLSKHHIVIETNHPPNVNPSKTNTICPPWKVKRRIGQDGPNENNSDC